MATDTDICNLALTRLGASPINDISDSTPNARHCRYLFDSARESTLRSHDWNFARRRRYVGLLSDTYVGWEYAYEYPTDCLRIIEIYNPSARSTYIDGSVTNGAWNENLGYLNSDKVMYEVVTNESGTRRVILTNQVDALIVYTALIENPTMYDSAFKDAMAWRLAADLALPVKGDANMFGQLMQMYAMSMSGAESSNKSEEASLESDISPYEAARG